VYTQNKIGKIILDQDCNDLNIMYNSYNINVKENV